MYSTYSNFMKQVVSPTYLFQCFIFDVYVTSGTSYGTSDFSNSIIKISASTGPKGEPIATSYV